MKSILLFVLLAIPAHAENVTITLPNGTSASVPGTGPQTSSESVLAGWVTQKLDSMQKEDFFQAAIQAARAMPPARRLLILKAIQKIGSTTQGGLQTISNAIDVAP